MRMVRVDMDGPSRMPPTLRHATNRRFSCLLGAATPWRSWSALRRAEAPRSGALPALTLPSIPRRLQPAGDLVEGRRVLDGGGHLPGLAVGDLLHGAAQDLA